MTQFKDKSQKEGSEATTVGLFTYPVLMAADVLLYDTDLVPVGEDQRQHLELTRDLARRFNTRFGQTFTVPEPFIPQATAKILDLAEPTRQMSKSVGGPGVLWLQDSPAALRKKVRSAVTDAGREIRRNPEEKPGITNLLTIYSTLTGRGVEELEEEYDGKGYGEFKGELADVVVDFFAPVQDRYRSWLEDVDGLDAVLAEGAERARSVATQTMAAVRDRIGLLPAKG
jgi:tryptophanyl-tRNA synthetase